MDLLLKILFYLASITSLISGIEVWVTGEPTSVVENVVDNFTLAVFFFMFGLAKITKGEDSK
jgi:hypothetical protein